MIGRRLLGRQPLIGQERTDAPLAHGALAHQEAQPVAHFVAQVVSELSETAHPSSAPSLAGAVARAYLFTWGRRTLPLQVRTIAQQMTHGRSDRMFAVRLKRVLFASVLTACCAQAFADETSSCTAPSPDCAVVGQFEISAAFGLGQRSNPVEGRSDIPLVVIPHISWYGKRFFLENLELGYTLHDGEANTFNLIASPGYDRVFFYKNDFQNIFIAGTGVPGNATFTSTGSAGAGRGPGVPGQGASHDLPCRPRVELHLRPRHRAAERAP